MLEIVNQMADLEVCGISACFGNNLNKTRNGGYFMPNQQDSQQQFSEWRVGLKMCER